MGRVPKHLRERVLKQAGYRCGYCLSHERWIGGLTAEHIIPQSAGGTSDEENLWVACRRCNEAKGNMTHAVDPKTRHLARLFNPRKDNWSMHFAWSEDGTRIIGLTARGRATVGALRINDEKRMEWRKLWVEKGVHPRQEMREGGDSL